MLELVHTTRPANVSALHSCTADVRVGAAGVRTVASTVHSARALPAKGTMDAKATCRIKYLAYSRNFKMEVFRCPKLRY